MFKSLKTQTKLIGVHLYFWEEGLWDCGALNPLMSSLEDMTRTLRENVQSERPGRWNEILGDQKPVHDSVEMYANHFVKQLLVLGRPEVRSIDD